MLYEELLDGVKKILKTGEGTDAFSNDTDIIVFLLDNCEIDIPECNRFFVKANCKGIADFVKARRVEPFSSLARDAGLGNGLDTLSYTGMWDFSHTNTEWQSVISLGIFGLRERIAVYRSLSGNDENKCKFYNNLIRVYDSALRFIERASEKARELGREEMAEGLLHLSSGSPRNLFEALATSIIYYNLQHIFDGTFLRTLGRLDTLFYPYYVKETGEDGYSMMLDFIKEIDKLEAPSNIPFAISGTDTEGRELTNPLTYDLLKIYSEAGTTNTKFHILTSEKTPERVLDSAFRMIRDGKNSIVFLSDEKVIESLVRQGAEYADAVNYHVVGCYECGADGEMTSSCNARVNIPKALEAALFNGCDLITGMRIGPEVAGSFATFPELLGEFEVQLRYFSKSAMKATELYEEHYREIHSSPVLSATYTSSLLKGADVYSDYTAKYNNSSVTAIGLATAVDSLEAIRRLVYEDKLVGLDELKEILKSNWEGREPLRQLVKNKYKKFGQADERTDALAKRIVDVLSDEISYKPNGKGGNWRLGLFSIDWRWQFGAKTGASADGRLMGESLSQNTSAAFGQDKDGATAHLISVARLDASKTPNGSVADIDLHSSSVSGENGIRALVSSLRAYFKLGGLSVHYNVLDTQTLIDARDNPEKYPTLQVRLCGWNVLFSTLSRKEKDEFIARSIK